MRSKNPGRKNRKILVRKPVVTNDRGEVTVTHEDFLTLWAEERPMRMEERYQAQARHTMRVSNFRVWFRSDITQEMVIAHEGRLWRVTGLAEVGNREELDITAEAVD